MRYGLFLTVVFLLVGCPGKGPVPPPPNPVPDTVDDCAAAEERLLQLGCKDSKGRLLGGLNRRGEPFRSVCAVSITNRVPMYARCLSKVDQCDDVIDCGR